MCSFRLSNVWPCVGGGQHTWPFGLVWSTRVAIRFSTDILRNEIFRNSVFGTVGEFSGKFFFPVTLLDMVHPNEGVGDEFF